MQVVKQTIMTICYGVTTVAPAMFLNLRIRLNVLRLSHLEQNSQVAEAIIMSCVAQMCNMKRHSYLLQA